MADPMGATLHALTFTSYFLELVYGTCVPPPSATALVTILVIELSAAVNIFSLRASMKLQDYLFIVRLGVLLAIIATGFIWAFRALRSPAWPKRCRTPAELSQGPYWVVSPL